MLTSLDYRVDLDLPYLLSYLTHLSLSRCHMWCDVWVWASALRPHNHILTHSLSLVLVVMMRSKDLKTSRSILMLILRFSLTLSCPDRLRAGGLTVAIMAGLTMSFAAITGGTLNSHSNWLLWAIGVATTTLSVVLLAATLLTRERLTSTNHEAQVPDTVGVSLCLARRKSCSH